MNADANPPSTTINDLLRGQAERTPDAVAIVYGDDTRLTYAELDAVIVRRSRALVDRGVGRESVVALAVRNPLSFWTTVLSVLRAGGAYLPIDPDSPGKRIRFMIGDASPFLIVADESVRSALPQRSGIVTVESLDAERRPPDPEREAEQCRAPATREDLAYVMYTSGSTGNPKGVSVSHAGIPGLVSTLATSMDITSRSRVLQFAFPTFDASLSEVCVALASGSTLVLADRADLSPGKSLSDTIARHGVTAVMLTPQVLAAAGAGTLSTVESLLTTGDKVSLGLVRTWSARRRMVNGYGPTETTVCATVSRPLSADEVEIPIGPAMAGTDAYVLDGRLEPLPTGEPGELYLHGPHLARGYLGQPGLTASRFVACPFAEPGDRMYRTGDLVSWNEAGELVFRGRVDGQVKINGVRIEPSEIEEVLVQHPDVDQAVVRAAGGRFEDDGRRLIAYAVPAGSAGAWSATSGSEPGAWRDELAARYRTWLVDRLPASMVPAVLMVLERLPLMPNGKLDATALPVPEFTSKASASPSSPAERTVADIFCEVLGRETIGVDDDFYTVGGDSVRAMRVVSLARARGLRFSVRQMIELRTVAKLAAVARTTAAKVPSSDRATGPAHGKRIPLLPVTQWNRDAGPGFERSAQAALFEAPDGFLRTDLVPLLEKVVERHELLRCRLDRDGYLVVGPRANVPVATSITVVNVPDGVEGAAWQSLVVAERDSAVQRLDPAGGVIGQFVWFEPATTQAGRLLAVVHHAVVDGVSWRILLDDLAALSASAAVAGSREVPPLPGTGMGEWVDILTREAAARARVQELEYWRSVVDGPDEPVGRNRLDPTVDLTDTLGHARLVLPPDHTASLLAAAERGAGGMDGLLVASVAVAVAEFRQTDAAGSSSVLLWLEGHGREESVFPGVDLTRTLGCFTTAYPVRVAVPGSPSVSARAAHASAVDALAGLPDKGIGYGLLRYFNPETKAVLEKYPIGQIGVNYLGRFGSRSGSSSGWDFCSDVPELGALDVPEPPGRSALTELNIDAWVFDTPGQSTFGASLTAPRRVLSSGDLEVFAGLWGHALADVARVALEDEA